MGLVTRELPAWVGVVYMVLVCACVCFVGFVGLTTCGEIHVDPERVQDLRADCVGRGEWHVSYDASGQVIGYECWYLVEDLE